MGRRMWPGLINLVYGRNWCVTASERILSFSCVRNNPAWHGGISRQIKALEFARRRITEHLLDLRTPGDRLRGLRDTRAPGGQGNGLSLRVGVWVQSHSWPRSRAWRLSRGQGQRCEAEVRSKVMRKVRIRKGLGDTPDHDVAIRVILWSVINWNSN